MASVLVVEDDFSVLQLLVRLLSNEKHRIRSATSGQRALELLKEGPCDLVVLDMELPGIPGSKVLELVRDGWPSTRVVCMTACGNVWGAVTSLQTGPSDCLEKPFYNHEFLQVVHKALDHRSGLPHA